MSTGKKFKQIFVIDNTVNYLYLLAVRMEYQSSYQKFTLEREGDG